MAVIINTPMILCTWLEYYVTPILQWKISIGNKIYVGLPPYIFCGYLILDSLLDDFFERWLPMQFVLFLIRVYSDIYIACLQLNWWLVLIRQIFDPPINSKGHLAQKEAYWGLDIIPWLTLTSLMSDCTFTVHTWQTRKWLSS